MKPLVEGQEVIIDGMVCQAKAVNLHEMKEKMKEIREALAKAGIPPNNLSILAMVSLGVVNSRDVGILDESYDDFVKMIRETEGPQADRPNVIRAN